MANGKTHQSKIEKLIVNAGEGRKQSEYKRVLNERKAIIKQMLLKNGVEASDMALHLANPQAEGGIYHGLDRLIYDPSYEKAHVPWLDTKLTVEDFKSLVMSLHVPKWAVFFRNAAAKGITEPNTMGMLKRDGTPNKDLQQLLKVPQAVVMSEVQRGAFDVALSYEKERIIARLSELPASDKYSIVNGKIRLLESGWGREEFKEVMSDAIAHSSPGYPYNGYRWTDSHDGIPILDLVIEEGRSHMENPKPFLFIQGARYTGDGDCEGQQRLVMQACAGEKWLGHIIADPLKQFIRYKGSGQLGIDVASKDIREMARGGEEEQNYAKAKPKFYSESDAGQWDAHITDFQTTMFDEILRELYDMDDHFTSQVVEAYQYGFKNRELLTGVGCVKTQMLPSGSAITTVFTFVVHEVYIIMADVLFSKANSLKSYKDRSAFGVTSFVMQGDDLGLLVTSLDFIDRVAEVYAIFGCHMKKGSRTGSLDEKEPCMVFLNQLIHLRDDVPNVIVPRWNFFLSESADQNYRTVAMDRTLLSEITSRCPHPTPRELTFARFYGKVRRYAESQFFSYIVKWASSANGLFKIKSWLGERMFALDDPLMLELIKLETSRGVEWPDEVTRQIDRQQTNWLASEQVLAMATLVFHGEQQLIPEHKPMFGKMRQIASSQYKQRRSVNRIAREELEKSGINEGTKLSDIEISECENYFTNVFTRVYSLIESACEEKEEKSQEEALKPKERKTPTLQSATVDVITTTTTEPWFIKKQAIELGYRLWVHSGNDHYADKVGVVLGVSGEDVFKLFLELHSDENPLMDDSVFDDVLLAHKVDYV